MVYKTAGLVVGTRKFAGPMLKGTRCLGSDELVFETRLKPFV